MNTCSNSTHEVPTQTEVELVKSSDNRKKYPKGGKRYFREVPNNGSTSIRNEHK